MKQKAEITQSIRVGIAGGAGYTAGELIRVLLAHPYVDISFVLSRSNAGNPIHHVHRDLQGASDLFFSKKADQNIDVLFLCLGHGESSVFLSNFEANPNIRIIDLSQDFRYSPQAIAQSFVYGLPEYQREAIKKAYKIANPGCFATAIQLAILPLAAKGLLKDLHISGITGATGAGGKLQETNHFPWRYGNIQAYKALNHQHLHEIGATINNCQGQTPEIHFVPMRGDFARGIYVCAYTEYNGGLSAAKALYKEYYCSHPFTFVSEDPIDLKMCLNTNRCFLHLEQKGNQLIIHACIDNLLKGAAGQAVQNMNLMLGIPEECGLQLKPSAF
jgi:N-acetyl-gamma-glutamyl-phosphate reductase